MSTRYLMCDPSFYDVSYVINPWMRDHVNATSLRQAEEQWQSVHDAIARVAEVELVGAQPGLPDMPFTANAGLVLEDTVVLTRFLHRERQYEEEHFERWFWENGFAVLKTPATVPFEGAGDALFDRARSILWMGYGHRSSLEAQKYLSRWLDIEVLALRLVDDRFYHLDTCFCPLEGGYLLYYPQAFDQYSLRTIHAHVPSSHRIVVDEHDALQFACNAVNVGQTIVLNQASYALVTTLEKRGFEVVQNNLSEFLKAGGAAKCLTLRLDEPRRPGPMRDGVDTAMEVDW